MERSLYRHLLRAGNQIERNLARGCSLNLAADIGVVSPSHPLVRIEALFADDVRKSTSFAAALRPMFTSQSDSAVRYFSLGEGHPGRIDGAFKALRMAIELAATQDSLSKSGALDVRDHSDCSCANQPLFSVGEQVLARTAFWMVVFTHLDT